MPRVTFRPEQKAIIEGYRGGKMGISAVPGSGKTFTLSHLAANLVTELAASGLSDGIERREVLIVTFTNTAVNSFYAKIAEIMQQERGLLKSIGYRVRTLHGLAHDIVRDRPSLVGLAEDFKIIDDRVSNQLIHDITHSLIGQFQDELGAYLDMTAIGSEGRRRSLEHKQIPELAIAINRRFIKHAKDNLLSPQDLRDALEQDSRRFPLVEFGLAAYEDYQRSLSYQGAVDFDDLVMLAIRALREDDAYCARLRERWPYVLEDEAQDSSKMQEDMLLLLSGNQNWVRVGDPNQAINTTFTMADPRFLRNFIEQRGVRDMPLYTSSRSVLPIIELANRLVRWAVNEHPVAGLRDAFKQQDILPTRKGEKPTNPAVDGVPVFIHYAPGQRVTPEAEVNTIAHHVAKVLENNPELKVAVLAPENAHAFRFVEELEKQGVPFDDQLLRSSTATRAAAEFMRLVLTYLSDPLQARALASVYSTVWPLIRHKETNVDEKQANAVANAISRCRGVESLLWPQQSNDWVQTVDFIKQDDNLTSDVLQFREVVRIWLKATTLPIDQLVLTVARDLFIEPTDIALGHKIAVYLKAVGQSNPSFRLPDFVSELKTISANERRFIGFEGAEQGYTPQPGVVTVATMHAAKGQEWDRVYLLSVSTFGFPSVQPGDNYYSEKWFIRDELNLEAEAMAQFDAVKMGEPYEEGVATHQARVEFSAERLRLLYVGITRARVNLVMTWNMGRFWDRNEELRNEPALPLVAMWEYQNSLEHGEAKD